MFLHAGMCSNVCVGICLKVCYSLHLILRLLFLYSGKCFWFFFQNGVMPLRDHIKHEIAQSSEDRLLYANSYGSQTAT